MQQILLFSRQKSRQLPKATIEEEKSAPLSETVSGTTFATAIETTSHNKSASLSSHRSFAVKAFIFTPTSLPPFRRREGEKQFCGVKMHRESAKIISMRVKTQNSSLVPFVAAAEAGGFAVVVDIFLKLFEMKPVWKFASSCGGFIYTGVYTKITQQKRKKV